MALKFEAGEGFEPSSTCTSKRVTFAMVFIPIYAIQLPERPPVRKHRREAPAVCYQRTKAGADREKPNPKLPPTGITPVRSHNPKLAVWIIVSERKVHRKRIRRNYFFYFPCPRCCLPEDFLVFCELPWEVFLYLCRVSSRRDTFCVSLAIVIFVAFDYPSLRLPQVPA